MIFGRACRTEMVKANRKFHDIFSIVCPGL